MADQQVVVPGPDGDITLFVPSNVVDTEGNVKDKKALFSAYKDASEKKKARSGASAPPVPNAGLEGVQKSMSNPNYYFLPHDTSATAAINSKETYVPVASPLLNAATAFFGNSNHPAERGITELMKAAEQGLIIAAPEAAVRAPLSMAVGAAGAAGGSKLAEYLTKDSDANTKAIYGNSPTQDLAEHVGGAIGGLAGASPKIRGMAKGASQGFDTSKAIFRGVGLKYLGVPPAADAAIGVATQVPNMVRGARIGGMGEPWMDPKIFASDRTNSSNNSGFKAAPSNPPNNSGFKAAPSNPPNNSGFKAAPSNPPKESPNVVQASVNGNPPKESPNVVQASVNGNPAKTVQDISKTALMAGKEQKQIAPPKNDTKQIAPAVQEPVTQAPIVIPKSHVEAHAANNGISYEEAEKHFPADEFEILDKRGLQNRLHGVGKDKGLTHINISNLARDKFPVKSLSQLTEDQLHELFEHVSAMPDNAKKIIPKRAIGLEKDPMRGIP